MKKLKKVLTYAFISVFAVITLVICAGYYMLGYALKPEELQTRSRNIEDSWTFICQEYPELQAWTDSLKECNALQEVYLEDDEGRNLHAYYICAASPTRKTAVIVHGYTDNAIRMLPIGYLYSHQLGYNVLLPDLHGHGLSDGNEAQMGWKDRLDVLQWTATAEELFHRHNKSVAGKDTTLTGEIEMVVHGISMGAATTMMLSGEVGQGIYQQPYIKCFVEDCGYTTVWNEFRGELKSQFGLPAFPLLYVASRLCQKEYGWNFREASALKQVEQCRLPMLFIHGESDTFVPTDMVYPLYDAKPGPKELWIVPGADHAHSYRDHKEAYTARVSGFVSKYIH